MRLLKFLSRWKSVWTDPCEHRDVRRSAETINAQKVSTNRVDAIRQDGTRQYKRENEEWTEEERQRKEEAAKAETARQRQEQIDRKSLKSRLRPKCFEFVIVRDIL